MKFKKMINGGMFALGLVGAAAASAATFSLPLGGLTLNGGVIFGSPVLSVAMDFQGWVTMLGADGQVVPNPSFSSEPTFHGYRTPIKGKMVMDIGSGGLRGGATFDTFPFFGIPASGRDVTFYSPNALLNLLPTNTLMLGNMSFDFGLSKGIPVSIVLDIGGLTTALTNTFKGKILKGLLTAESDNTLVPDGNGGQMSISMGPVLVATTSLNTTDVDTDGDGQPGPIVMGTNPSGTTPLIVDKVVDVTNGDVGIGGSPMKAGPFTGFNANFDIVEATVTCVSALSSCNTFGLKLPPLPPLTAQPFGALLQFLPQ